MLSSSGVASSSSSLTVTVLLPEAFFLRAGFALFLGAGSASSASSSVAADLVR